ncbi:TPA: hypothetical protein U0505_000147 [Streptococcus suis]|uniref:Uncharacterized protein n=3 Tax=Streptococcus suis TaxID=1307 RepID=A0AB37G3G3_STRSU|nr:hypothetical protein [Streptococcus suis]AEB80597.1 membrane protein [Streptococcus suis ST3]HEM3225486.1 hypothetical protein [Streptococcus suis 8074]HEM3233313.1 hypothetical protein [Streptococcus suis 4961]AER16391.1 membrane protein [Streptococcus suis D9]MBO8052204.1 hypothetical protein [Streptococcus suis]
MKIYKFMFNITYPALILCLYIIFRMKGTMSPWFDTLFLGGGFLVIPLLLILLDYLSVDNDKRGTDNEAANQTTTDVEKSEA